MAVACCKPSPKSQPRVTGQPWPVTFPRDRLAAPHFRPLEKGEASVSDEGGAQPIRREMVWAWLGKKRQTAARSKTQEFSGDNKLRLAKQIRVVGVMYHYKLTKRLPVRA